MRRKSFRKPKVFYLPSTTFGLQQETYSANVTGQGTTNVVSIELTPGTNTAPPDVAGGNEWDREGPQTELIIRSVTGQVFMGVNTKATGGTAPAGIAGVSMRCAIFSTPEDFQQGTALQTAGSAFGSSVLQQVYGDIANTNSSFWGLGSRNIPGVTLWWARGWYASMDLSLQTQLNSGSFDSPSSMVHLRSAKRLRANQRLWITAQAGLINTNGVAGTLQWQCYLAPSLQLAARRVRARRF